VGVSYIPSFSLLHAVRENVSLMLTVWHQGLRDGISFPGRLNNDKASRTPQSLPPNDFIVWETVEGRFLYFCVLMNGPTLIWPFIHEDTAYKENVDSFMKMKEESTSYTSILLFSFFFLLLYFWCSTGRPLASEIWRTVIKGESLQINVQPLMDSPITESSTSRPSFSLLSLMGQLIKENAILS